MVFRKMHKNQSGCAASPEEDFAAARGFMNVYVGAHYLFNRNVLFTGYLPLEDIDWCYKRVEENAPGCGCVTILSKYLMIVDKNARQIKISLDNGLVIDEVMDALKRTNPGMKLGYYEEQNAVPCYG
jgi:hypothetical protein